MSLHQLAREGEAAFRIATDILRAYGIGRGDVLILGKHALSAGQRVLASLNGRLLIGRVWNEEGAPHVVLASEPYAVIQIAERDEFQILGEVTGVVRRAVAETSDEEQCVGSDA